MMALERHSKLSLWERTLFGLILIFSIGGFVCSIYREVVIHSDASRRDYLKHKEVPTILSRATLITACASFALGSGFLFRAWNRTWRHLRGSLRGGGLVLACVVLLAWIASIVLAGLTVLASPSESADGPPELVGVVGGVCLLTACLLLIGIYVYMDIALRQAADHGKANEDEESGGVKADGDDGGVKRLSRKDADTPELSPQETQKRPTQSAPSGDAFAWQELTNSEAYMGRQKSSSQSTFGQQSTSSAAGGVQEKPSAPPAPAFAPYGVTVLSIAEVVHATENFSSKNSIGQGGFSHVYRGNLADGRTVAVKRLHFHSLTGGQETAAGERDFQAEATVVARVHHRHLVQLVGFCTNAQERILVLEYMKNGNLADNLYGNRAASLLTWPQRMNIAIGAAKGLTYLHEDCLPRIIHRDIKASNILLDANRGAKISDFGFARFTRELQSTATATRTVGTFQYLPPECALYGEKNSDKSDVYSFGVVLLELLAGRPPLDPGQARERVSLIVWARQLKQTRTERYILDKKLGKAYSSDEVWRVYKCALRCIDDRPEARPSMGEVLRMLEGVGPKSPTPKLVVGQHSTVLGPSTDVSMAIPMTLNEGR